MCATGPVILYLSDVDETACGTSERFNAFLKSWGDQYGPISTEQLLQQGKATGFANWDNRNRHLLIALPN